MSKIGAKVGYLVVQEVSGHWIETDCPTVNTIGQAMGVLRGYQESMPEITYAVAKLELVMISRPE